MAAARVIGVWRSRNMLEPTKEDDASVVLCPPHEEDGGFGKGVRRSGLMEDEAPVPTALHRSRTPSATPTKAARIASARGTPPLRTRASDCTTHASAVENASTST